MNDIEILGIFQHSENPLPNPLGRTRTLSHSFPTMTTQDTNRKVFDNVIQSIGNTPITKLHRVTQGCPADVYVKMEFMNPGGSIKDRIGYWLIEDFEKKGELKPGGTIVEGTSGNTGMGLAIAAAIKGYRSVFVLPDKMSNEKIRTLRAFGAKVVVTPTAVEPDDPRSYYSVSKRLAREIPNSVYINQYNNLSNRECHYKTTGPEIYGQMPDLDVFVAGIGTGGTVCGVSKFLKEKNPKVKTLAVDPVGSIVYDAFKTGKHVEAKPYKVEGIGEDFLPENYDFKLLDDMVQVEDKDAFIMTRELLTKEGLFAGVSSGAAVVGAIKWAKKQGEAMRGKKILVILPDSGNRYLSKVYDDDWMREAGFLEAGGLGTVNDLMIQLRMRNTNLVVAKPTDKVSALVERMREHGISQVPVRDERGWIKGVVTESGLLKALYQGQLKSNDAIEPMVDPSVEFVKTTDSLEHVSRVLTSGKTPLVSEGENSLAAIITKIDLLAYLGSRA